MFEKISDAAKYCKIDGAGISKVCKGKQKTINRTRFRYVIDGEIQYLNKDEKLEKPVIKITQEQIPQKEVLKITPAVKETHKSDDTPKENDQTHKINLNDPKNKYYLNLFIKESEYNNEKELDQDLIKLYDRLINNY